MWAKAKQKKEETCADVKVVKELERDDSHVIKQYYENTLTAFTEVQKGVDYEDIEEDQRKLVEAVSSLALQDLGGLPSKELFSSILLCITENRSATLSVHAYNLLKKLQQKFPATMVVPGDKVGQNAPYLQVDKQVWTPLDAVPGSAPLRGTAAAASAPPPTRAGARPRANADGTVGRPGDLFEVLNQVAEDLGTVSGRGGTLFTESAPTLTGRRSKKANGVLELDEGAKQQAQINATEAHAIQRLGSGLMFKYIVSLLYDDLSCRLAVFRAHGGGTEFKLLVESLLYRLLVSLATKAQRDHVWTSIFAIIKAGALERQEEVVELRSTPSKSEGGDAMEVEPSPEEASATPPPKKGKKRKSKGRRSSASTASQRGPEPDSSNLTQISIETPFEAALERKKDDLAAEHGLSCSRQDLCTTAQTLLASMLELTAAMESKLNLWKANETRTELLDKIRWEFCPSRCYDPLCDTQRHFLETMLSPEQKLRFIIDYVHAISPKGSESWKVLDRKRSDAKAYDLLLALRENTKKLLKSSTPDEIALLAAHAVQAELTLGCSNTEQLKQELDEMSGVFREALGTAERRGRSLSAASNAALVAAAIAIRLASKK